MQFWTNFFEFSLALLFCYGAFLIIRQRSFRDLSTLLAGFIFGIILEYLNIYLTGSYEYSQHFVLQIGSSPNNVPICIALAWGMLLLSADQLFHSLALPIWLRAMVEAVFVVNVDLFLDVLAVRLEGGFWIWHNAPLTYTITAHHLFGISWGNFFGWWAVIFSISLFFHLYDEKWPSTKGTALAIRTVLAVVVSEVALIVLLLGYGELDQIGLGWLLFLCVYCVSWILLGVVVRKNRARFEEKIQTPLYLLLYAFSYLYLFITMPVTDIVEAIPWYYGMMAIFAAGTIVFVALRTDFKALRWN